jgi:hypothetical protein
MVAKSLPELSLVARALVRAHNTAGSGTRRAPRSLAYPRFMHKGMNRHKDSELERWAAIVLRSLHLAGVVWLGSHVVALRPVEPAAAWLMLCTGLLMLAMDLRARRMALGEVAGAFVLVKLALVAWIAWDPRQVVWLFWLLLVASSVVSHAPKGFRHWPGKKQPGPVDSA